MEPAARFSSRVEVISESPFYRRGSEYSFLADCDSTQRRNDSAARARLVRHATIQEREIERRSSKVREELRRLGAREKRDLTTVAGFGGSFVVPLNYTDEFSTAARAGRSFADRFNLRLLPPNTSELTIPRITTGTATAAQASDNAAIGEVDIVSGTVSAGVKTIAGQQDVAIQLLEQSPAQSFDELILADLTADLNTRLDTQLISGTGASGQLTGVLNLSGTNAVTYTDATPTAAELWPKIGDALRQVAENRKLPATGILMHPRRWFWLTTNQTDAQSRPIMTPAPPNQLALEDEAAPVGSIGGVNVWVDSSIPINLGGPTNEDRIIVSRFSDHWAWESVPQVRILPEINSQTLTENPVDQLRRRYCRQTSRRHLDHLRLRPEHADMVVRVQTNRGPLPLSLWLATAENSPCQRCGVIMTTTPRAVEYQPGIWWACCPTCEQAFPKSQRAKS